MQSESIGCLLIGETKRMRALRTKLYRQGIDTVSMLRGSDMLGAAMDGLQAARRRGSTAIAAEGEMWAVALALAAQLCVEKIVLIAPTDCVKRPENEREKQIDGLKRFARRNLFFCVSGVLVLENAAEAPDGRMTAVYRRMCNASVRRIALSQEKWMNCKQSLLSAAARFLHVGDFEFTLAK